jgi:hypothetical protein
MQAIMWNAERERSLARQIERVKQTFADFQGAVDYLKSEPCKLKGIELELAPNNSLMRIAYEQIELELRLTYLRSTTLGVIGRVSAVLTKHPLDASRPILERFQIDRDGNCHVTGTTDADDQRLSRWASDIVMTLVERALMHEPADGAKVP